MAARPTSESEPYGVHVDLASLALLEHAATGFTFLPRQPVGSVLAGQHASRLRGRGMSFEELRAYVRGDDVRRIDWRVSSRMRKTHVRVFTEERDRPVLLVVDQRQTMFFGTRRATKAVVAAEAAALIAWRTVDVGDRIGAFVVGEHGTDEFRARRSKRTVHRILGSLVDRNAALGVTPPSEESGDRFIDALTRARAAATNDHLVVIVSDFAGDAEVVERQIALMMASNDVVLAFVYDTLEAQVQDAGRVVVGAGEMQAEIDTSQSKVRDRFHGDFKERLDAVTRMGRRHGLPILTLETAVPAVDQFRRQLGLISGNTR